MAFGSIEDKLSYKDRGVRRSSWEFNKEGRYSSVVLPARRNCLMRVPQPVVRIVRSVINESAIKHCCVSVAKIWWNAARLRDLVRRLEDFHRVSFSIVPLPHPWNAYLDACNFVEAKGSEGTRRIYTFSSERVKLLLAQYLHLAANDRGFSIQKCAPLGSDGFERYNDALSRIFA